MNQALSQAGKKSQILPLLAPETASTRQVALSQACFWTGELAIGGIEGVIRTEAGWLGGAEVTLVSYDPRQIDERTLITEAEKLSCARQAFRGAELKNYRTARESDQKRQIQGTTFAKLDTLTPFQRTKVNAFARTSPAKAKSFLSPRQKESLSTR